MDVLEHVGTVNDVEAVLVERDVPQIADYRLVQILLFLLADPECVFVEIDPR
jgi:hypothetical protein